MLHLVTAADGAPAHYTRRLEAHRSEPIEDAVRLDRLLHQAWRDHPRYYRLDNEGRDWVEVQGGTGHPIRAARQCRLIFDGGWDIIAAVGG